LPKNRHYRLTWADAEEAHDIAILFGGLPGIINEASILSALGRPYTGYYRSIARKAAALVESMARNHGFADGNKRTTLILTHLLISRSGYRWAGASEKALNREIEDFILTAARGELDFDDAVRWFNSRLRRR
jgi:death-on-curing protein